MINPIVPYCSDITYYNNQPSNFGENTDHISDKTIDHFIEEVSNLSLPEQREQVRKIVKTVERSITNSEIAMQNYDLAMQNSDLAIKAVTLATNTVKEIRQSFKEMSESSAKTLEKYGNREKIQADKEADRIREEKHKDYMAEAYREIEAIDRNIERIRKLWFPVRLFELVKEQFWSPIDTTPEVEKTQENKNNAPPPNPTPDKKNLYTKVIFGTTFTVFFCKYCVPYFKNIR